MREAPLDMRMDHTAALTAREVVNTWSQEELRRVLYEYGEERYAPAIARAIVKTREASPVETTLELADIVRSAMPPSALREKQHPAKRTFQAIRIAVNGELHLPAGLSRVRVRQKTEDPPGDPEACCARGGGAQGESPGQERQAPDGGEVRTI